MPGDIITLQDVKLKGYKGIQTYHRNIGEGTPVVVIIGEYEPKKSEVKAYQASQHVGNQVGIFKEWVYRGIRGARVLKLGLVKVESSALNLYSFICKSPECTLHSKGFNLFVSAAQQSTATLELWTTAAVKSYDHQRML